MVSLPAPLARKGTRVRTPAEAISAMIDKYSLNFPRASTGRPRTTGAVVLLTGSTGSLGSYILSDLLNSSRVSKVYAFNRASSDGPSSVRQRKSFEEKSLPTETLQSAKVVFLEGDANAALLGLQVEVYEKMHASVTHIIHNAWTLSFSRSLPSFEPNISATRRLIDFALTSKCGSGLKFVFTSSISVGQCWNVADGPYPEEVVSDPRTAVGANFRGYGEGKYVAEQILAKAADYGLDSTSLRIHQICGSRSDGAWAVTEWMPGLVKVSLALKCMPVTGGVVSFVPMDAVASVVEDVTFSDTSAPLALNVAHPRPVEWSTFMGNVASALARDGSEPLLLVPLREWVQKWETAALSIKKKGHEPAAVFALLGFFRGIADTVDSLKATGFDKHYEGAGLLLYATEKARSFSPALDKLSRLDYEDAQKWVAYWRKVGFI